MNPLQEFVYHAGQIALTIFFGLAFVGLIVFALACLGAIQGVWQK